MKLIKYIFSVTTLFLFACEEGGLLIEPDISNKSVILLAPSNNVEVSNNTIYFDWEALEDADQYEIQVVTPNFDNASQYLLNTVDSLTNAVLQLTVGEYQWRVRAKNSNYQTQYTVASFKVVPVENFSDNTVILNGPINDLVSNQAAQELSWQGVDGATLYRIQIIENGNISQELTTSDTLKEVVFSEGEFVWQVRAENGLENTLYFSRSILIDLTPPNIPELISPTDGQEVLSSQVSFEWSREILEGSAEFDSIYVYRNSSLTDLVLKAQSSSPFDTPLSNDTYYWLVKGFDEAGNQGDESSTYSVIVNE